MTLLRPAGPPDPAKTEAKAAAKTAAKAEARSTPGELALRRDMPLVPISSIAGRALVTIIAIMTFLGSLTAGAAVMVAHVSSEWRHSIVREMTIQIRPVSGRDLDADVARATALAHAAPGVAAATPFDRHEGERLLEPWLGAGLDLHDLPIPRLIVVKLDAGGSFDGTALRKALETAMPGVSLDDHRLWMDRLGAMADTVVAVAVVILALVLAAMGLAVGFATRGAMAGNQEIVGVLHFVGAEDGFIAGEFQRHFLRLGLRGGLIGGVAAIVIFLLAGSLESWLAATPGGDQLEALFGGFSLGLWGYVAILVIALLIAVITGLVSRVIVQRHLKGLE